MKSRPTHYDSLFRRQTKSHLLLVAKSEHNTALNSKGRNNWLNKLVCMVCIFVEQPSVLSFCKIDSTATRTVAIAFFLIRCRVCRGSGGSSSISPARPISLSFFCTKPINRQILNIVHICISFLVFSSSHSSFFISYK